MNVRESLNNENLGSKPTPFSGLARSIKVLPPGKGGTLSGGQVIPSSSPSYCSAGVQGNAVPLPGSGVPPAFPSYLVRRRRRHESGTRIVTKGPYMVREIHNRSARLYKFTPNVRIRTNKCFNENNINTFSVRIQDLL